MVARHLVGLGFALAFGFSLFGGEDVWIATNLTERYDSSTSHTRTPKIDSANNAYRHLNGPYWESENAYTFQGDAGSDLTLYFTNDVDRLQRLGLSDNSKTDYRLGSLVGSIWHDFCFTVYGRNFKIVNALDFKGTFHHDASVYSCNTDVLMMGDGDKTTGFDTLRTQDYLKLRPQVAGQDILLRHVYGFGLWSILPDASTKTATVTVDDSQSGGAADLNIQNSATVTLNGPEYETPALLGTPAFHLDASVASSLTAAGGAVTEWRDLAGSGIVALPKGGDTYKGVPLANPTLRTDDATGLPVVDLGVFEGDHSNVKPKWTAAEYGATAALRLSSPVLNVRELFVVMRDKHGYNTAAQFIGTEGIRCFRRNYTTFGKGSEYFSLPRLFEDPNQTVVHRAMAVADVRVDGCRTVQTADVDLNVGMHVVSIGVPEAIRLDYFGYDGAAARYGGVQIAEVIAYTTALTSAQRREVNAYLKAKWMRGEAAADRDYGKLTFGNKDDPVKVGRGRVAVRELSVPASQTSLKKTGAGTLAFAKTAQTSLSVDVQGGGVRFDADPADGAIDTSKPAANPVLWFDASKKSSIVWHDETKREIERWNDCRDGTNYMGITAYAAYETGRHKNGSYTYKADQTLPDGTEVKKGDKPKGNGIGAYPTYVEHDSVGGYPGVDFGQWVRPGNHGWGKNLTGSVLNENRYYTNAWETASYLIVVMGGATNTSGFVREAFVVARPTANSNTVDTLSHLKWFNSATTRDVYASADGGTMYISGNAQRGFGGRYTRNGVSLLSGMENTADAIGVRACAGARFTGRTALNGIAICGDGGQNAGSGLYSELVYYDRVLTEKERRQTEAYLMAKWGIGEHPYANRTGTLAVPTLTFADGVDAVVDANRDLAVTKLTSDEDTLVKKGTGAVTIENPITQPNVTVSGGALAVSVEYGGGPYTNALVHFDASDLTTMDWAVATRDSEVVTNVTKWYDTRSRTAYNKLVARVTDTNANQSVGYTTYFGAWSLPTVRTFETRTGSDRYIPAVDFGELYYRSSGDYKPNREPADQISPHGIGTNATSALMEYTFAGTSTTETTLGGIREVFIIVKDNVPSSDSPWKARSRGQSIVGGMFSTNSDNFRRGSSGKLIGSDGQTGKYHAGNDAVINGLASLDDGEEGDPTKIELPADGFHLVWFQPTNGVQSGGLAFSRMQDRGGLAVAELAIFDHVLTDEKRTEIKASLMNKWFTGGAIGTVDVGALTVAKDAELTLSADSDLAVRPSSLLNAGTLRMASGSFGVAPGGEIVFAFGSPKACARIVQDEAFDLTGGGTFVVDFAGQRIRRGSYELIRAAGFIGTLANWTIRAENLNGPRRLQLRQTATSVYLDILPGGAAVYVR